VVDRLMIELPFTRSKNKGTPGARAALKHAGLKAGAVRVHVINAWSVRKLHVDNF
jgi:hypothetical protein